MDHTVINELHCKNESNFKKIVQIWQYMLHCKTGSHLKDGSHYEQLMSHTEILATL